MFHLSARTAAIRWQAVVVSGPISPSMEKTRGVKDSLFSLHHTFNNFTLVEPKKDGEEQNKRTDAAVL